MKSVLISIQPKWCELIASGKKTIEVRKTVPKEKEPFKVYIYQTKKKWIYKLLEKLGLWRGKVIGEFVCNKIDKIHCNNGIQAYYNNREETCISDFELRLYATEGKPIYFWHISDLKIYDTPKALGEFRKKSGYCDDCKYLDKDIRVCRKYGKNLVGNEIFGWYFCCDICRDKNTLTCPPQSWCYVEEL